MNLTSRQFHVVKFLFDRNSIASLGDLRHNNLGYTPTTDELLETLVMLGLVIINNDRGNVSLTDFGIKYITGKETEELILLHETVFDNYDFALLQFLYNRNNAVYMTDFPEILKTQANQHGNAINDGNLIFALFRLQNYIANNNNASYQITDTGKAFYKNLLKRQQAKAELQSKVETINIHGSVGTFNKDSFNPKTEINNAGDGNVVNTGSNSSISANISIYKNDLQRLNDELRKLDIEEDDIVELNQIIKSDILESTNTKLPTRVNMWIGKMFGKALEVGGKIATSGAGNILATLVRQFYGLDTGMPH